MTHFESVGVGYQYSATNATQAKKAFDKSCDICGKTGKYIRCDKCAIAFAHSVITSILK